MDIVFGYFDHVPFVAVTAAAFWIFIVVFAISPGARAIFRANLVPVPAGGNNYFETLDFLRGALALLVVFHHGAPLLPDGKTFLGMDFSFQLLGASVSVPFFAFISGFVVWLSLDRARHSIGTISGWIIRRIFRLYPLYFLHILVLIVIAVWTVPALTAMANARKMIADLFMLHSFYFSSHFVTPSWSLYPELLYSLLLPAFVLSMGGWRRPGLVAAFVVFFVTSSAGNDRMFTLFRFLAFGSLIAEAFLLLKDRRIAVPQGAITQVFALLAPFVGFFLLYDYGVNVIVNQDANYGSLLARIVNSVQRDIGFLLVAVGLVVSRLLRTIVTWYPLRAVGIISYSIYLMHIFVLWAHCPPDVNLGAHSVSVDILACRGGVFADNGLSLVALYVPSVLFISAITFVLVEDPCRKWGNKIARQRMEKPTIATAEKFDRSQIR